MEKWTWKIIDGEVFIVCGSKKVAKMLTEDFSQQEMIDNTSSITVHVNDFFERKEKLETETI